MNASYFMIRFGELSTKGDNKKVFIDCLYRNIKHALKTFAGLKFEKNRDHIFVRLNDENPDDVLPVLQEVAGIQRISLVVPCEKEQEKINALGIELVKAEEGKTFKIETKRIDKTYPLKSYDVCIATADAIIDATGLGVDVHNPDITLHVEIGFESAFLYCHEYEGAGGYPLGMNGKVLLLLSGGIDSPVAAYSLLRRGIKIECLHFASPPYTSDAVLDKLKDLLGVMNKYQEKIKLHVAPFTKLQESIYKYVDEPYCITEMRRMMMRIAEHVAIKNHCLAIATGESIGQVASQTLDSVRTINNVTNYPILRPLAVEDKVKIVNTAKRIGTYEISIRPFEDCCTIFKPKKPKTKPKVKECEYYEAKWDWQSQVLACVAAVEKMFIEETE